jgi:hypothetical protein
MTSPVDTSVKHFTSGMTGGPVSNGTAGSTIGVLDSCLVDGWGLQTATSVVVASGVATVTFPSAFPATVDSVILVDGATPSGLNGEQKVTSLGSNIVRFATAEADVTATGTITVKMAPAGWTKVFSGTNKAVYKSADPMAHGGGMYLRVDDTGTTSCRIVGYEAMSDVDTGTGPFPTAAQISGGGYWAKSSAANSTAVRWAVLADSRFFFFASSAHTTVANGCCTRGFGDLIALRPSGDAFATALSYGATSTDFSGSFDFSNTVQVATPRGTSGLGSSALGRPLPYIGSTSAVSGNDTTIGTFPNPNDGALYLSRRYWATAAAQPPRAHIPGLLSVPQGVAATTFAAHTVVPGSGEFSGRNLLVLDPVSSQGAVGYVSLVDITGPWR